MSTTSQDETVILKYMREAPQAYLMDYLNTAHRQFPGAYTKLSEIALRRRSGTVYNALLDAVDAAKENKLIETTRSIVHGRDTWLVRVPPPPPDIDTIEDEVNRALRPVGRKITLTRGKMTKAAFRQVTVTYLGYHYAALRLTHTHDIHIHITGPWDTDPGTDHNVASTKD